jgi:hypothetical protein
MTQWTKKILIVLEKAQEFVEEVRKWLQKQGFSKIIA